MMATCVTGDLQRPAQFVQRRPRATEADGNSRRMQRVICVFVFLFICLPAEHFAQGADASVAVSINAVPGLQYDVVRFMVRPGASVTLTFGNNDDMSHNLVFTKPGARIDVVNAALRLQERGPAMDYIPSSSDILWHIAVLSPGEKKSLTFKAPQQPGVYPYVCTFPGHGFTMYGAMYVGRNEDLPPIENDLNIPEGRRKETGESSAVSMKGHSHKGANARNHPYDETPPHLYRVYMPDATPAAIAINLPHDLSYCWDAGTCDLRYAWRGGFIDNSTLWKGKPNGEAKIIGTVFYRNHQTTALRIGQADAIPTIEYKGYRLIRHYPEFHYTLNGIDVYELIRPREDGAGLVRNFRIPGINDNVWFCADPDAGVAYECAAGRWKNNRLLISNAEAHAFSIVITQKMEKK